MILATLFSAIVLGQSGAPQAKTELIASATTIAPGQKFSVALHMTMAPGWHSYYINPGESGMATSIKWHLPPGFKAGPIRWPAPTRVVTETVAAFVYEHETWLVTDITAPALLRPGQSVTIGADANWLLCHEACFPQKSELKLTVQTGAVTTANSAFAQAASRLPAMVSASGFKATLSDKTVGLTFPSLASTAGIHFFPADATYFGADEPIIQSSHGIKLIIPMSRYAPGPPKRLVGILVMPSFGGNGARWIDIQVTKS